jgi:hypothetical protein
MEQQWGGGQDASEVSAETFPSSPRPLAPHPAPRGTLAGTVLTITGLLLGYVGFVRLLF